MMLRYLGKCWHITVPLYFFVCQFLLLFGFGFFLVQSFFFLKQYLQFYDLSRLHTLLSVITLEYYLSYQGIFYSQFFSFMLFYASMLFFFSMLRQEVILPWSHSIPSAARLCARVLFQKMSQLMEHRVRDLPNKRKMRQWLFI